MTTTYINYGAETTVASTELNALANAAGATGAEQDNTTNRFIDGELDVVLAASGANTGYVDVYLIEGTTTGNLATFVNLQNARFIGSVQLNGATVVRKRLSFSSVTQFWKVLIRNDSGIGLAATGNTVKFTGVRYVDV